MKKCVACGAAKRSDAPRCPVCEQMDEEVLRMMMVGTPGLTLVVLGLICFWIYRFYVVGWAAWSGNLRIAALIAMGLGLTVLVSGPLWIFGIRNRTIAVAVTIIAGIAYLVLNQV